MDTKKEFVVRSQCWLRLVTCVEVLALMLCLPQASSAQMGKRLKKHCIIALDRYPGIDSNGTLRIEKVSTVAPKLEEILNSILDDNDFVSVVNYSLGVNDPSFDCYTTCTVNWSTYESFRTTMYNYWPDVAYRNHANQGNVCSLLTGAKFYSFHSLHGMNEDREANKVYLLQVTDEYYNGGDDYKKEFSKYKEIGGVLNEDEFRKTISSITRKFNFQLVDEYVIERGITSDYKAILYEVVPNTTTLNTTLDYPANLGLRRVRGGYKIDFKYRSVSTEYRLRRLEVSPVSRDDTLTTEVFTEPEYEAQLDISYNDVRGDTIYVVLRGWLEQVDDIYSGLILNPYDEAFKNLTVTLGIPLGKDPKIFGLLPLKDSIWWWYPEDAEKAVLVWDAILLAILLTVVTLTVIFLIRKYISIRTTYQPTDADISISHV